MAKRVVGEGALEEIDGLLVTAEPAQDGAAGAVGGGGLLHAGEGGGGELVGFGEKRRIGEEKVGPSEVALEEGSLEAVRGRLGEEAEELIARRLGSVLVEEEDGAVAAGAAPERSTGLRRVLVAPKILALVNAAEGALERGVEPAGGDQLVVGAALDDGAAV